MPPRLKQLPIKNLRSVGSKPVTLTFPTSEVLWLGWHAGSSLKLSMSLFLMSSLQRRKGVGCRCAVCIGFVGVCQ